MRLNKKRSRAALSKSTVSILSTEDEAMMQQIRQIARGGYIEGLEALIFGRSIPTNLVDWNSIIETIAEEILYNNEDNDDEDPRTTMAYQFGTTAAAPTAAGATAVGVIPAAGFSLMALPAFPKSLRVASVPPPMASLAITTPGGEGRTTAAPSRVRRTSNPITAQISKRQETREEANKNDTKETQEEQQARTKNEAKAFAYSDLTVNDVRSLAAAKRKQAAFNIDDETEGRQSKKQKFIFKCEIPTTEQMICSTKNCSQKAIAFCESNLKPGYYRTVCFDCQQDVIGGLPDGVEPIKTMADVDTN